MRLIAGRTRLAAEHGYTMIAVIGAISLVSMLAAATLVATNGDINLVQFDLDHRRAHAAAEGGIADYSFHLNNDNSYWSRCTNVPEPNAVNQQGSTAKRRPVPGVSGEEYALETLPATGQKECLQGANAVQSMLEQSGPRTGSFRIRSTGFSGDAKVSVVATYKRASLLDYVYFTRLETSDPVTYGEPSWSKNAYKQCEKFIREGRQTQAIPESGGQYCDKIVFTTGDDIDGPMHTNDAFVVSGTPSFGETPADVIEAGAPTPGWYACSAILPNTTCKTANPTFVGPFVTTAPILNPPATNDSLEEIAGEKYTYSCQTEIKLEGATMTVTTNKSGPVKGVAFPPDGVIYIKGGACPDLKEKKGKTKTWPACEKYSPFKATYRFYPEGADCGNVYVSGTYSGELTIAAEEDIIISGNLEKSGSGLLGLIANNFIRVRHPFSDTNDTNRFQCDGGENLSGFLKPLRIDAAMLAIDHSFIVDHYDCGASLGTLTVNGAISQKFRGAVGSEGGTGYLKDYNYDRRLRYMEPPHFLNPVEPSWHIQRETLDYP
jgi:hypothetical protein